ncbi:NADP-dependent malic enzyme [Petrotoga sp. 9PWA.NaAc.5.4]|uniref:NAD(P)-dependent malic enzyme n=1 Tax=Petrotoga sp. 9PWA.NaAc.5.4 TaxID=1434328 RepID=UPI000CB05799|nr:NADP-dependent malic enzyme [Petrotoga sp. 9PWA.NaAc.5.4]PNR96993.1 malate dehydrogenase [Petrotoga sp. 9PWA.NaAc.5.4]
MDSQELHRILKGKIRTISNVDNLDKYSLSLLYTPGVADVAQLCSKDPESTYSYTRRWNSIAIVSDGSAVLGLGNIGPYGALPVMEGKALLFNLFAGLDAIPICLDTQNTDEIINIVKSLEPSFGGINLEDIAAPRCFKILEELNKIMDIPVFHDDQQGTAVVVTAGFLNALKVLGKESKDVKVVVNGIGAAGYNITKFLIDFGVRDLILVDKNGILNENLPGSCLHEYHRELAKITNLENLSGDLSDALVNADVFIGVSKGDILTEEIIRKMKKNPIIFALANPIPEINPIIAKSFGASIVATGRSDYPNQINNLIAFPGIMKGALEKRSKITKNMLHSAIIAIANSCIPTPERILPEAYDKKLHFNVYEAVKNAQ